MNNIEKEQVDFDQYTNGYGAGFFDAFNDNEELITDPAVPYEYGYCRGYEEGVLAAKNRTEI